MVAVAIAVAPDRDRPRGHATPPSAPCPADVRALLGGVSEGTTLAGFRVKSLDCGAPRVVDLHVERGGSSLVVSAAAKGTLSHAPPAETERTSLFYGRFSEASARPSNEDVTALVEALAAKIRDAEARVPPPAGW
jgi:hypothetical protein